MTTSVSSGSASAAEVRPHQRNQQFNWTSCRESGRTLRLLTDEEARQWDDDGFVLLKGAFTREEVAAVEHIIDPAEAEMEAFLRAETDDGTLFIARADEITFTTHMVARSPELAAFSKHRVFLDLVYDVIGPDVRFYWDQAVYKKPHTEAPFPWHQDNGYAFVVPQQYLTCWIPLTAATLENGCPWVVPGLHKLGTLDHRLTDLGFICMENTNDSIPVEADPGDVVVFSSLTPHSTGANRTDHTRKAYITQYAPVGAYVLHERSDDPSAEPEQRLADHPVRQYPVLVDGHPA